MPIVRQKLTECLKQMKGIYLNDSVASVRSQAFINVLHDYCIAELHNVGITEDSFQIRKEATIYGSHKKI